MRGEKFGTVYLHDEIKMKTFISTLIWREKGSSKCDIYQIEGLIGYILYYFLFLLAVSAFEKTA